MDVGTRHAGALPVSGYRPQAISACVYEGKPVGTSDAGTFRRVIVEHNVKCTFTAPTAYRATKQEASKTELVKDDDMSSFKILFLADERSDSDTIQWSEENLGVLVNTPQQL